MTQIIEQPIAEFNKYPPVGCEDWQYTYATAVVRALESKMLTKATLVDMANAEDFKQAVELLGAGEYALGQTKNFTEVEDVLKSRRTEVRHLFVELMADESLVELLKAREDFANMRLALRRKLTEKPLGTDYCDDGSVPAERFEEIFEEEDYSLLPFYMREAIERAVLAYYQEKDIRQVDLALDAYHAEYKLQKASELKNVFLTELFRMQIDLTNIRTMLRLKFTESEERNVFLSGGYVAMELLKHGIETGYDAIGPLFYSTPYSHVVEAGVNYLALNKSFLQIEQKCEEHLMGFLKSTVQITAGPQPVIAYLLRKENEIRMVRLVLTAKKNALDAKLILDRLDG